MIHLVSGSRLEDGQILGCETSSEGVSAECSSGHSEEGGQRTQPEENSIQLHLRCEPRPTSSCWVLRWSPQPASAATNRIRTITLTPTTVIFGGAGAYELARYAPTSTRSRMRSLPRRTGWRLDPRATYTATPAASVSVSRISVAVGWFQRPRPSLVESFPVSGRSRR